MKKLRIFWGFLIFAITFLVQAQHSYFMFTGAYTSSESEGINVYSFDPATPSVSYLFTVKGIQNPSFLLIDHSGNFLYAVNELETYQGKASGAVSAFSIDRFSGKLKLLNMQPTYGGAPCHLTLDDSGKWLFVANYLGGNVAVFPVLEDGTIGDRTDFVQHQGKGVNPDRQEGPHAHQVVFDAQSQILWVADLGLDKVFRYRLDRKTGHLTPDVIPWIQTPPGSGPRHMTFSRNHRNLYVLGEINSRIYNFNLTPGNKMKAIQDLSMLPAGFSQANTGAEIAVSPGGKYLFASNRGHNSLVQFSIDPGSGMLTLKNHFPSGGMNPRFFCFDPTGNYLFAANQTSDNIVVYKFNSGNGLSDTGIEVKLPKPVCIVFLKQVMMPE